MLDPALPPFHPAEEPEAAEGQASATHIQSKYAYFRPRIQTELELDDPKSVREVFMRGERAAQGCWECHLALAPGRAAGNWLEAP